MRDDLRIFLLAICAGVVFGGTAHAAPCPVDEGQLRAALRASVKPSGGPSNGGLDNNEWAAVVDRSGAVCALAYSGEAVDDQWLGSRAIAAEKAFTANGFSLDSYAISTANLYAGAQPGGFLFGIGLSNPADPRVIYAPPVAAYGTAQDPILGKRAGGVIVFGGGLALYDSNGVVGALGASGDTSCADHNIAWRIRSTLKLDAVPAGPNGKNDGIIYDIGPDGKSASGYGHPKCGGTASEIAAQLQGQ